MNSENRIVIDFSKHHHLGWTHYRILLGVEAGLKRGFYMRVSEYLTHLPPKSVLEDRLKIYSRLLEQERGKGE
ncbi:MAG: hypothetical protein A3F84_18930 [Candidatus Handelsmanbacteria bacterium RIFCSPLOWO2_12_FULL_64_10]|uniref:YhcG N-terminal domain-containing protein n=1 Tax=Handelsmanbacteria sp. (strain RIFCSPLOWO2_12_FULL_64_10) TaxID=1817868 RepID=A0A1F6C4D9_HANXR|nr:MAG: hypothetical protein A3F84_18930 [Candidatus Handelsmanbacteria bacterium RIFCSPLOWO2_12_FULL_64_10]